MPRTRSVSVALAVAAVCLGLAACGSSSSGGSTGANGIAGKSPGQIVSAAINAAQGASSAHLDGTGTDNSATIRFDLSLVRGRGGVGTLSLDGLSFQLIEIGQTVYIKAGNAFWKRFGGQAAARLFHDRWLKAPATGQFASIAALANLQLLFGQLLSSHGPLARAGTTTIQGQPAVAVRDKARGATVYVATKGKPFPLEIVKPGASGGRLRITGFNRPVALAAPAHSINVDRLG